MRKIPVMVSRSETTETLVDDDVYQEHSRFVWRLDRKGYVYRWSSERPRHRIVLHRIIMGATDPVVKVDHRNRTPLDNQRANLRTATPSQNIMNGMGKQRRVSRYKGVSRAADHVNPWRARITRDGHTLSLGCFPTEEAAAVAYNAAALEVHGEFACLNEVS